MSNEMKINIASSSMKGELDYWKGRVDRNFEKTQLYFKSCEIIGSGIKRKTYNIDNDISKKGLKICRGSHKNIFAFMYSALSVLLYKYGNPVVSIEVPIIKNEDDYNVINKKIPLIQKIDEEISFKELLIGSQKIIKDGYRYGNYPISKIYDLKGDGDHLENPLTDILLGVNELHNINTINKTEEQIAIFILTDDDDINLKIEYNNSLFDDYYIDKFVNHLCNILTKVIDDIDIKISEIDFLSENEINELLVEFNRTEGCFEEDKTVHQIFENISNENPNDIALVFDDKEITYFELNKRSDELARKLIAEGVTSDTIVGVLLKRSVEMVIALLGILKAGGAYLPIDPKFPKERVLYMIKNSKTRLVLSSSELCEDLQENFKILDIYDNNNFLSSDERINVKSKSNDLAYVIYTSGSTGKPKGVMIEHRQVVNFSAGMNLKLDLYKYKNILCITTISFDIFVLEMLVPLMNGMKVVLTKEGDDINWKELKRLIVNNSVEIMQSTPSRLNILMNINEFLPVLSNLKVLLCGGEPIQEFILKTIAEYKNIRLFNMYGPTETTVWSLVNEINNEKDMLIGKPILNTKIYILNKENDLVAVGALGELCIGGEGLARGYLFREELTKEKFINSKYFTGEKIYKTGDVARWTSDGRVECLGRVDRQVKIRGYRIELGEIESNILKIDTIEDVRVIANEREGIKYLCAYYISDCDYNISYFRNILEKKLPDYMIPSYFVKITKMPLTPNGKTDNLELQKIKFDIKNQCVMPRNELEGLLLSELKEILAIDNIGVTDNLFDFGANSLNIMRFIQRIQGNFDISYEEIIKNPYICKIAESVKPKEENTIEKLKKLKNKIEAISTIDNSNGLIKLEKEIKEYREKYISEYSDSNLIDRVEYNNILLCGATGYLGVYLLKEMLKNTKSYITLIVRGDNLDSATKRIEEIYQYYFQEELSYYKERIKIYNGDLSKENLGLNFESYEKVKNTVSCIINSAANVSHFGLYEDLYMANVKSVENLLRCCAEGQKKYYVQISTVSVGSGNIPDKSKLAYSEYDGDIGQYDVNNYIKTKLEAEELIHEYGKKGINYTIFRVGNIVFNSQDGRCQKNIDSNAFYQRIKSLITLRKIPDSNIDEIEFSYVDFVSKAIITLFNIKALSNEVFHINNNNKLSYRKLAEYSQDIIKDIELLNNEELIGFLIEKYDYPEYKESIDILLLHSGMLDSENESNLNIVSEKTIFLLERCGFTWPNVEKFHIERMIRYAIEIKFFY